ncbi:MAG: hypothetical protein ACOZBW_00925 [Thermodesulfobacteriota bacterium]
MAVLIQIDIAIGIGIEIEFCVWRFAENRFFSFSPLLFFAAKKKHPKKRARRLGLWLPSHRRLFR